MTASRRTCRASSSRLGDCVLPGHNDGQHKTRSGLAWTVPQLLRNFSPGDWLRFQTGVELRMTTTRAVKIVRHSLPHTEPRTLSKMSLREIERLANGGRKDALDEAIERHEGKRARR